MNSKYHFFHATKSFILTSFPSFNTIVHLILKIIFLQYSSRSHRLDTALLRVSRVFCMACADFKVVSWI